MSTPFLALATSHPPHPMWIALFIVAIVIISIWDGVWKVIGMWKSARHGQLAWFICLAIFNTMGILPILYILFFQKPVNPPVIPGPAAQV